MSRFIRHDTCPKCGSVDNLAIFEDNEHCFSVDCNYHKNYNDNDKESSLADKHEVRHAKDRQLTPLPEYGERAQVAIKERNISYETVKRFRVGVNTNPDNSVGHVYPYFDSDGAHVANKIRRKGEKSFYWEGQVSAATLFGQQAFKPGEAKQITVVEGELDALSAYELTGSRYPCVSVKSASEADRNVADNFEYLNSFNHVVINFDNDEAGNKAAIRCAQLFEPGKVRILQLRRGKDASDYLQTKMHGEYLDEWFKAPNYHPDGLKIGRDMWEEIINHKDPKSVPYPWEGLNKKTYGIRRSEAVLITADRGVGKTSYVKEIEYSLLMNPELIEEKAGVGFLHFEEPNYDTVIGLMSIHNNKPYHLPDVERSTEELRFAYEAVIANERVVIWDHFGSNNINDVLDKIRHMAALGCRYIVLDHLSIVVSDQSGDERKQLDEISTKIKMLCMEKDIAVICVIHINRQGLIRGSAGPEQLANIVVRLDREMEDLNEWRRNVTKVVVTKNRFCGRTGPACYLHYSEVTGRLSELSIDQVQEYEEGGNGAGNEMQF
jgi:twinkle protein